MYSNLFILVDYTVERKSVLSSNKYSSKPEFLSVERKSNMSFNRNISKLDITNTPRQHINNKILQDSKGKILFLVHLKNYYSQNDIILSVGIEEMCLWKIGKASLLKKIVNKFSENIDSLVHLISYNQNNDIIAILHKDTLSLFNLFTEDIVLYLNFEMETTSFIYHSNSNSIISGHSDGTLKLWDINLKKCTNTIIAHYYSVECLCLIHEFRTHKNDFLASGGRDHIIYLWDMSSSQRSLSLKGHNNTIISLHNSELFKEKDILISGSIRNIKVWKLNLGVCVRTIDVYNQNIEINYLNSVYSNKLKKAFVVCGNNDSEKLKMIDIGNMKHIKRIKKEKKKSICVLDGNEFLRLFYIMNDGENNLIIIENEF